MIDFENLKREQEKLSKKIVLKDCIDKPRWIAGSDVVYTGKKVISVMVVFDYETFEKKESKYTVMDAKIPHYNEFAGFRQSAASVETYHKLEIDPDIIIVQGTGIIHPRGFGEACQLGLLLDKPTIGVSKNLLLGVEKDNYIISNNQKLGQVMYTKEHAKPIYISPGHRTTIESSVNFLEKFLNDKKMPLPVHEAHKVANKLKKKLKDPKDI
ncbi:MAG: endonuclease V [Nanobdellota archaeon]